MDFGKSNDFLIIFSRCADSLEPIEYRKLFLCAPRDPYVLFTLVSRRARIETEFVYKKYSILIGGWARCPECHVGPPESAQIGF